MPGTPKGSWRLLAVGVALAALAACEGRAKVRPVGEFFAGAGKGGSTPAAARAPQPSNDAAFEALDNRARAAYESAKGDYSRGDLAAMQKALEQAVKFQPDFTEAWYNLGACRGNRALEAIRAEDESGALALFRSAVDAKRRAKELIDQGVWYVYLSTAEQQRTREDVEAALEDADVVLDDEASLLTAMRLMAGTEE